MQLASLLVVQIKMGRNWERGFIEVGILVERVFVEWEDCLGT